MAKITIFGLAGTGTTSVGKILAGDMGYQFLSSGNIFRKMAEENKMTLGEFEDLCKKEHKFDLELDQRIKKFGEENDNFIIESRLAWHFIPDSVKIKLDCDFDTRINRIANREAIFFETAKEHTVFREDAIFERYKNYYGIDDFSDKNFDFTIDTTNIQIPVVVKNIENFLKTSFFL
ncbi:cytidylate kinase family protein [Candidatus Giovannonibacteria bacterium]|nr:cytidylate kinase family protein [Candidatus Giovannonibacteria bacterium]